MNKILSVLLAFVLLFSASLAFAEEQTYLNTYETKGREVETWNVHYSQQAVNNNVMVNLIDGLDGLAVGISAISSISTMLVSLILPAGIGSIPLLLACLAGSCFGFM
ncbi:MAG: hypothetical protein IJI45_08695, partial [Anaerolineaceae bacterium]|nr:hypothetical protein [Anaerolineaceae bacterium]